MSTIRQFRSRRRPASGQTKQREHHHGRAVGWKDRHRYRCRRRDRPGNGAASARRRRPGGRHRAFGVLAARTEGRQRQLVARVVDVTDEQQVKDLIAFTVQNFGKLDGIVNNAGVLIPGTILDASIEDYQKTFDVNVKGVFLGSKYAIPELLKAGGGSIVNFGSINSIGAEKLLTAYTASKGAVLTLTKAIALDFGAQGHPGEHPVPGIRRHPAQRPALHRTRRPRRARGRPARLPADRTRDPADRDRPLGRVPALGSLDRHHRHRVRRRRRRTRRSLSRSRWSRSSVPRNLLQRSTIEHPACGQPVAAGRDQ